MQKTDCLAELRRLLEQGPPMYISDKHALPLADGERDTHICRLWYADDGLERSALLTGALQGSEREELWDRLKALLADMKAKGEDNQS